MRIAFYAPMKPPTHKVPSGDRAMARLLMATLRRMGHDVELASALRSYEGKGDDARQHAIARRAIAEAQRLGEAWAGNAPDLWFTYHLYHKAPDHIGPRVAGALGLPYVVAEPSVAPKQRRGPWAAGFALSLAALARADALLPMTREDADGLFAAGIPAERIVALPPFLDAAPYDRVRRAERRRTLAAAWGIDPQKPWAVVVAMMRAGDKLASYRVLGEALPAIAGEHELVVIGDGPCRAEVAALLGPRAHLVGRVSPRALPGWLGACDLFLWPAVNEAYGMALLAAQAAGLPVVAGRARGVPGIVAHGSTGLLTPEGDAAAFAAAATTLLAAPRRRAAMGAAAAAHVRERHGSDAAASVLARALDEACRRRRS